MQSNSRGRRLCVATVTATLALAGVALAATPSAGSYRATGAVRFSFTLKRGTCFLPRPVNKPNAPRGKSGVGLCLSSTSQVPLNPDCGADGHAISGLSADLSLFDRLRLTSHGLAAESVGTDGYTELELSPDGRGFTGFIRATDQDGLGNPCDTGKLSFKANLAR